MYAIGSATAACEGQSDDGDTSNTKNGDVASGSDAGEHTPSKTMPTARSGDDGGPSNPGKPHEPDASIPDGTSTDTPVPATSPSDDTDVIASTTGSDREPAPGQTVTATTAASGTTSDGPAPQGMGGAQATPAAGGATAAGGAPGAGGASDGPGSSGAGGGAGGGVSEPATDCDWYGWDCVEASDCPDGYECDTFVDHCVPIDDRTSCGGFTGAACNQKPFRVCLPAAGSLCATREEAICFCRQFGVGCDDLSSFEAQWAITPVSDGQGGMCLPLGGIGCAAGQPNASPCCDGLACNEGPTRFTEGECWMAP